MTTSNKNCSKKQGDAPLFDALAGYLGSATLLYEIFLAVSVVTVQCGLSFVVSDKLRYLCLCNMNHLW